MTAGPEALTTLSPSALLALQWGAAAAAHREGCRRAPMGRLSRRPTSSSASCSPTRAGTGRSACCSSGAALSGRSALLSSAPLSVPSNCVLGITEAAPCGRNDAAHAYRKLPARPSKQKMQFCGLQSGAGSL